MEYQDDLLISNHTRMRLEYEQHEEGGFKIALPICVGERILGGGSRWNIAFKSGGFFFCFFFF